MGVEYAHYYIVKDLHWVAPVNVAREVNALLERWELVAGPPDVFDLSEGRRRKIPEAFGRLPPGPSNLALSYPMVEGPPSIERIMGASFYPPHEIGPRYFQGIEFVMGADYRVHPSDERVYVDVGTTPMIESPWRGFGPFEGTVLAEETTPPPKVQVECEGIPAPPDFRGIWRCALRFDCGKDLPAFIEDDYSAPGTEFAGELTEVLGQDVLEIGFIY